MRSHIRFSTRLQHLRLQVVEEVSASTQMVWALRERLTARVPRTKILQAEQIVYKAYLAVSYADVKHLRLGVQ